MVGAAFAPAEGEVLAGRYRVERVLGGGGMGVVVAAVDARSGQRVALKLMHAHEARNAIAVERFDREGRAASRLSSEHTLRVLGVERTAEGRPFMVMELLEGEDLGKRLKASGPLPAAEAARYIRHAALACAEAHTLGVVHRDIKPSNIVVVQRGAERVAKVVDFGVSKMKGLAGTQMQALTADGDLTGSPLYMPPEQLRTKEVDGRADVWSLGASLYELVTGARPFQADNMMVECNRILMEQPRPPSQARAGVPQALDAVVLRCLEKDPARRFATGTELAAALEPFAAKPKSGGAGGRAVVAVAVVALAIAGAAVAWRARPVMSSVVDAPPSADASAPSASASDAP